MEKATSSSNVQRKIDNFSQKKFSGHSKMENKIEKKDT